VPLESELRRAGTYADERYKDARRRYRRRARPVLVGAFGPFVLAGVVVLAVGGHPVTWIAGAVTGAVGAAWIIVRDEPPAYIEHWREGAEGERKTEKALMPLKRSGLRVFHDVQMRYGNYDHVAVGRAGVFLVETKNPNGVVEVRGGVPHIRRRHDPQADKREVQVRTRALSAAADLSKEIKRRTGLATWVQAVVVFWADFPEGVVEDSRCVYIYGPRLRSWMQCRQDCLDQPTVDEIATAVASLSRDGLSRSEAGSWETSR
jgi:Nuclease-related domain